MNKRGKNKGESKKNSKEIEEKDKTNKLLLENFIALQEALTNLGYELKDLNKKVSSLLEIFETAAKNFQEHPESRNLSAKINEIIEQNKIIAKTLLLMHKSKKEYKDEEEFEPSIISKKEEENKELDEKTEEEKDEETEEEFKPEPLPEFNF